MDTNVPSWISVAMRLGYAARAVFYGLLGFLAVHAAWLGGHAEGAEEALGLLANEAFGFAVLWLIAVGAFGFALWGAGAAVFDLDRRGRNAMGVFARADYALTAVIYTGIGVFVAQLAEVGYIRGGGDGRERSAAWLMSLPAGDWIVIILGVGFAAAGSWFIYKGCAALFRERLSRAHLVERLDLFCRFGWAAYGVVIIILGGFLIWSGWTVDASKAGGFAEAFAYVRGLAFGRVLLLAIGLGFIAFALECCVEAVFRFIPGPHPEDLPMAHRDDFRSQEMNRGRGAPLLQEVGIPALSPDGPPPRPRADGS